MYKKRSRQINIYQFYMKFLRKEIICQIEFLTDVSQQIVKHKIIITGSQHYVVEQKGHGDEVSHRQYKPDPNDTKQHPAQFLQVVPKSHFSHDYFFSLSVVEGSSSSSFALFISSLASFTPSLKLLTPLPNPRISSGIFFPPKSNRITSAIMIHSDPLGKKPNSKFVIISYKYISSRANIRILKLGIYNPGQK